jgi:lipopolysaccharide/colanic/teichoic acid biosynthesis glycosyltransferase
VLKCKPGITGLAAVKCAQYEYSQLSGKTAQQAEEIYCAKILPKKLRYDLFYFQAKSLSFDTLIVLWTLGLLLKRKGIANPL